MNNINELKQKKRELEKELYNVNSNIGNIVLIEKREKYREQFKCSNCRYNCIIKIDNFNNCCLKDKAWQDCCCEFEPSNRMSQFILAENYPSLEEWDNIAVLLGDYKLEKLFDVEIDFDKAIAIHNILVD